MADKSKTFTAEDNKPTWTDLNNLKDDIQTAGQDRNLAGYKSINVFDILDSAGLSYFVRVPRYNYQRINGSASRGYINGGASGDLSAAGAGKVITLMPFPWGITVGRTVYISGGTGTAEAAVITGKSGSGGDTSGTVTVTTTQTHTGSWTAASATAGIQEALDDAVGRRLYMPVGAYDCYSPIVLPTAPSIALTGDINCQVNASTRLRLHHSGHGISLAGDNSGKTILLSDFVIEDIDGNALDGIHIEDNNSLLAKRLWVSNFKQHGIYMERCWGGKIEDCIIYGNKRNGVYIVSCNAIRIIHSAFEGNGVETPATNWSAIFINGVDVDHECSTISIEDCVIENSGVVGSGKGFGVGMQYCQAVSIRGGHFEANAGLHIWTGSDVRNLSISESFFLNNYIYLGTQDGSLSGAIIGNLFRGTAGIQTDLSTGWPIPMFIAANQYVGGAADVIEAGKGIGTTQFYYGTAAPVAGTWARGAVMFNTTPSAAGYLGWVCVTAGTPGTWKGFGLIES